MFEVTPEKILSNIKEFLKITPTKIRRYSTEECFKFLSKTLYDFNDEELKLIYCGTTHFFCKLFFNCIKTMVYTGNDLETNEKNGDSYYPFKIECYFENFFEN